MRLDLFEQPGEDGFFIVLLGKSGILKCKTDNRPSEGLRGNNRLPVVGCPLCVGSDLHYTSMLTISPDDRAFLHQARVGRLATASAAGEPHVVPVCFVFDGTCLYSAIDAKPKRVEPRRLRRLLNLRENPRACLIVDHYEEEWARLRYVLMSGRVEILETGPDRERALVLLQEKYSQYRSMPGFGQGPVIRLIPEKVASWRGASPRSKPPL